MITLGLDFIVIKDHRGGEGGFFWSDVQQFANVFDDDVEWVKVKFRRDHEDTYTMIFNMSVKEFLEEVKEQLNYPPRLYSDDKVVCEAPATKEDE